ncbi:MAG: nuclease, partial [Burkholderiales bacterium]
MQQTSPGSFLYSASDVVHFLDCEHLTSLDLRAFNEDLQKAKDDEQAILIQEKGNLHENAFVEVLKARHASFIDIAKTSDQRQGKADATLKAMREGIEIIFQATFLQGELLGHADFLRRVETPSSLGSYSYEVLDTKLARSIKAKFVVQLAFYSDLLANVQGLLP